MQNLLDCTDGFYNNRCQGGLMDNCFSYVAKNEGINNEKYEANKGECRSEMKNLLLSVFILMAANLIVAHRSSILKEWKRFKKIHRKIYSKLEDRERIKIFKKNWEFVREHNAKHFRGEVLFRMKATHFLDWFPREIKKMNGLKLGEDFEKFRKNYKGKIYERPLRSELPDYVNWVEKGAVTKVKNQGECGSCYSFSAAAALEGLMYRQNKTVTDLSAQNLLDCTDGFYNNNGCEGGLMHNCFSYVAKNEGINNEKLYPYEANKGECRFKKGEAATSCTGFVLLDPPKDEELLKSAVATMGPVSVGIHADSTLLFYSGGIYSSTNCSDTVNHGVLIVGYGTDKKTKEDYWLIKNSWGTKWGVKGYGKILRNSQNMCNIADYAVFPV